MQNESAITTLQPSEVPKHPEVLESNEIKVEQGSLVLMVGPPGAGKSTFAEKHFPNEAIVPTDGLRQKLSNNPGNQLVSGEAFDLAAHVVSSRLKHGKTVVLDAMNLDPGLRQRFARFAQENDAQVVAVYLDVPETELIRRDSQRMKSVGKDYLRIRAQRAQEEIGILEQDPNVDTVYKLNPETAQQAHIELSQADSESLSRDIEFAKDVRVAETNLLEYATTKIEQGETLGAETPRLIVEAGSINFLPGNEDARGFLERNVLPSQVVDLEWVATRMGTIPEDPAVYHYAKLLVGTRESLNLTTFVIFGETTAELATRLHKEGKYSQLHDELDKGLLNDGVLEVDRTGDEDTPLLILGDIHGCMTALRAHERNVFRENQGSTDEQPKRRMLFVGDIADRGPYDAEAVIFTAALVRKREAVWVKGNHDVNLENGLSYISEQAQAAIEAGATWEEWLSTFDVEKELKGKVLSEATRNTIQELLYMQDKSGQYVPRLKLSSINKVLAVLNEAPTYKEYKHLVAVHASLPRIPRPNDEQNMDKPKIHTHGMKQHGPRWTGRAEVREMPTVVAKDPDVFAVSGHTHKGAYINEISGVANLDYDGGNRGEVAAMYWMGQRHGEIAYEQEPSMLKLYEQLNQSELPEGQELVEFLRYVKGQGMVETKQGPEGSAYEGLTIINYSQITELQSLWEQYPSLRNFRGLIIDSEGDVVARPFKKTHKAGIEIPLEELSMRPDKVFEKANGSMGICYHYNGEWHMATKFSFDNEGYTQPAKQMLDELNTAALDPTNTYLFEIILRDDPHIVDYGGEQKLILLNATDTETGQELEWDQVAETAGSLGVELVPDMTEQFEGMTIAQIYEYAQTSGNLENMEGLMAQYIDPETGEKVTVKVKAIEYDKRKFVRDRLAWKKLIEGFDWVALDIPQEGKEALLAYNLDDPFVRSALETRVSWLREEYSTAVSDVQEFVMDLWIEAQEVYDNVISSGRRPQEATGRAMSVAAVAIIQKFETEDVPFPQSARNSILGFVRGVLSDDPQAYERLESYARDQIQRKIDDETQKRGRASYWLTPED